MPDFSTTVSVLRRWESFDKTSSLPRDFQAWKQQNSAEFMRLAKADPELVSLLDGTAPAGLVADALTGSLSPIPKSPEQRLEASQAEEVAQLLESNPYKTGNLTQALRLEQLNPDAAARLRKESGVQSPAEKAAAEAAAKQAHEAAMSSVAAAGALRRQQELEQRAAQLPTFRPRY